MVILGLVLIALGALAIVLGLFTAEFDHGDLQFLGIELSPVALFFIGVAAAVPSGGVCGSSSRARKRSWARRKEQKRLEQLSEKLDDRRREPPRRTSTPEGRGTARTLSSAVAQPQGRRGPAPTGRGAGPSQCGPVTVT